MSPLFSSGRSTSPPFFTFSVCRSLSFFRRSPAATAEGRRKSHQKRPLKAVVEATGKRERRRPSLIRGLNCKEASRLQFSQMHTRLKFWHFLFYCTFLQNDFLAETERFSFHFHHNRSDGGNWKIFWFPVRQTRLKCNQNDQREILLLPLC